ncbi:MAG: hypothetical protein U9R43_07020 [Thermodesulfobacteriota bacterium]|nr:hypothetical protein [Thermodesulfobacteriota bacterium]
MCRYLKEGTKIGLATNKLIPVDVVVKGVPSLDTKGHNVVEDTLC